MNHLVQSGKWEKALEVLARLGDVYMWDIKREIRKCSIMLVANRAAHRTLKVKEEARMIKDRILKDATNAKKSTWVAVPGMEDWQDALIRHVEDWYHTHVDQLVAV